jgi:sortase A
MPIIDSVSEDALAAGVGRFVDNAPVGAVGNYALAAHRVTHGEPFRNLTDLVAGDEIVVEPRSTSTPTLWTPAGPSIASRSPTPGCWMIGRLSCRAVGSSR